MQMKKNEEEMVGVETVIKKKRALSLTDEADTENKQDNSNTTNATKTAARKKEMHGNATTATTAATNQESHGNQGKDGNGQGSLHQAKRKKQPQ
jgi:hypothetical protein